MTIRRDHLPSLDIFRGVAVAGMILVNNPGNWTTTFESLTHADGNGFTPADLVFPCFVFILGAAMPFAFARRIGRGQPDRDLYLRIARRGALLILLGLILNAVAAAPAITMMRIPGVLQRIGLVYLIAAPIVIHARPGRRMMVVASLVLAHWILLAHDLAGSVDRAVFGGHTLNPAGDPEGLLGTMPAVATALLGSIAGDWLLANHASRIRVSGLIAAGVTALALGMAWTPLLPLNKTQWTGSFVFLTGGIATLLLTLCHVLFDLNDGERWAQPFAWLGFNPLAIYFLAELCGHLLDAPWPAGGVQPMTLRAWIFWDVMHPLLPNVEDEWLSLAFGLATLACWTAAAGALHRRGVRIQV